MSHYEKCNEDMVRRTRIVGDNIKLNDKSDPVNHPSHYNKHPSGIECKDIIEHFSYHLGCAVKYVWRCDDKGKPIEDLQKAIQSIQFEIDMRQRGK